MCMHLSFANENVLFLKYLYLYIHAERYEAKQSLAINASWIKIFFYFFTLPLISLIFLGSLGFTCSNMKVVNFTLVIEHV